MWRFCILFCTLHDETLVSYSFSSGGFILNISVEDLVWLWL